MISIEHLTKRFGPFTAVDDVSFDVPKGEVLGFLGPNGAGKSTTMKMLTGFLTPTSGRATVCGHDVHKSPIAAKRQIGYLPEGAPAYPDMTPKSFLEFVADVRGLRGADRKRRMDEVVEKTHIDGVLNQPIDTLSKGFKRRVGMAQAMLNDPPVLVMDEPTDGLDPNQKHEVRNLIRSMAQEKAIVLSTHILEEVESVCSRALIINRGKVVFDGTPQALEQRSRMHNAVSLTVGPEGAPSAAEELTKLDGVSTVETLTAAEGRVCYVAYPKNGGVILPAVRQLAQDRGWKPEQLREERGRLDDVFRSLTTSDTVA